MRAGITRFTVTRNALIERVTPTGVFRPVRTAGGIGSHRLTGGAGHRLRIGFVLVADVVGRRSTDSRRTEK